MGIVRRVWAAIVAWYRTPPEVAEDDDPYFWQAW